MSVVELSSYVSFSKYLLFSWFFRGMLKQIISGENPTEEIVQMFKEVCEDCLMKKVFITTAYRYYIMLQFLLILIFLPFLLFPDVSRETRRVASNKGTQCLYLFIKSAANSTSAI